MEATLSKVVGYLQDKPFSWKVLVVDDGSTDDTAALVRERFGDNKAVQLISVPHGGKGWAIKQGMLRAKGQYCFLCDADLSMPIEQLSRFLPPTGPDSDIVIGSREVPGARRIGEPLTRHLMGRIFNLLVRFIVVPGLQDTQCGFKCLKGEVAQELGKMQRLKGFGFDVELLFLAHKLNLRVTEIPIDWHYRSHSKIRPLIDSLSMVRELLIIRWNYLTGRYGKGMAHLKNKALEG